MFIFVRALAFVMGGPLAKGMLAVSPFYNPTGWLAGWPRPPQKSEQINKSCVFTAKKAINWILSRIKRRKKSLTGKRGGWLAAWPRPSQKGEKSGKAIKAVFLHQQMR